MIFNKFSEKLKIAKENDKRTVEDWAKKIARDGQCEIPYVGFIHYDGGGSLTFTPTAEFLIRVQNYR